MAKRKKEFEITPSPASIHDIGFGEMNTVDAEFQLAIETDPKYSLEVDPTHIYNLSETEIDFIEQMVQYKNVQFVSTILCGLTLEEGVQIYKKYAVKEEIKRINMAMYARRFCSKMADLNQLGGYLTTALIDENIAVADRLSPKEKLTAAKLLINLNLLKKEAMNHPEIVDAVEIKKDLDKLSPNELKQLIEYNDEDYLEKEKLIEIINQDGLLTMEELTNLKSMSIAELEDLVKIVTAPDGEETEENGEEED